MPMHDWTLVKSGIFHAFHHDWITALGRALNKGLLPDDYYALPEQQAAGFGPDVLTLQLPTPTNPPPTVEGTSTTLLGRPQTRFMAQTDDAFYRKKKSSIVVRHVTDDRIVAMIEVVSAGNKASRKAFHAFVDKACEFLEARIHLLLIDPYPPGKRDPNGIHGAIWSEVEDDRFQLPADKPLTLVSYESDITTRAYVETIAVGDRLPDMPLFLEPNGCINVPLEATYLDAYLNDFPKRWRTVVESSINQ